MVQVQAMEVELIALCGCIGRGDLEDASSAGGHGGRTKVLADGHNYGRRQYLPLRLGQVCAAATDVRKRPRHSYL